MTGGFVNVWCMTAIYKWISYSLLALCLLGSGCKVFRPGDALKKNDGELILTPISTKHRYLTVADLSHSRLRVALIDVVFRKEKTETFFSIGQMQPQEGLLKLETTPQRCTSLEMLIEELDQYIDRMPIGLLITMNGELPTRAEVLPPAFQGFIRELQNELDREKIMYAFLVPAELHLVE